MTVLALTIAPAHAASSHGPVSMSASVSSVLDLSVTIFEGDVVDDVQVTSMNFGSLTNNGFDILTASKHFSVLLGANTSSRAYIIRQTATDLTFGTNTLPDGAQVMAPNNNGNSSLPGTLGAQDSWVGTNKVIYTSDSAGSAQVVGAVYAIGDTGTEVVPLEQPGGTYAGSVTFTLVLAS